MLVSGCSFVLTRNPNPPPAAPNCPSSPLGPIADTAVAVVAAIGIVYFATSDDDNANVGIAVETALTVGFGSSAYIGYRRVGRCRDAKALAPAPRVEPAPSTPRAGSR